MDEVHVWRRTYNADLVHYVRWFSGGIAWCFSGSSSRGFGVTGYNSLGAMTLAHELGHNCGAAHDPANYICTNTTYGRGHNFLYRTQSFPPMRYYAYTVMSYPSGWGSCTLPTICRKTRQPHFSSPLVTLSYGRKRFPTGTATRDNARALLSYRQKIANYRRARFDYVEYGTNCKGVASCNTTPLQSYNWNRASGLDSSVGEPNEYAIKLQNPGRSMDICKVQLRMRTVTGSGTARISIYDSIFPHQLLGRTTMHLTTSHVTRNATFKSPVRIKAGAYYYVGVWLTKNGTKSLADRFEAYWPISTAGVGTTRLKSIKRTSSWSWAKSCECRWNVRVFSTNGLVPNPQLRGTQFIPNTRKRTCTLQGVNPGMTGLYLLDFKPFPANTHTGLSLAFAGAAGCRLYNLGLAAKAQLTTDSSGQFRVEMPVPGDSALCGLRLYEQFVVAQPGANALGLIFSNGGWGRVSPW